LKTKAAARRLRHRRLTSLPIHQMLRAIRALRRLT